MAGPESMTSLETRKVTGSSYSADAQRLWDAIISVNFLHIVDAPVVETIQPFYIVYSKWQGSACISNNWADGSSVNAQIRPSKYISLWDQCFAKLQDRSLGAAYTKFNLISDLVVQLGSGTRIIGVMHLLINFVIDVATV